MDEYILDYHIPLGLNLEGDTQTTLGHAVGLAFAAAAPLAGPSCPSERSTTRKEGATGKGTSRLRGRRGRAGWRHGYSSSCAYAAAQTLSTYTDISVQAY